MKKKKIYIPGQKFLYKYPHYCSGIVGILISILVYSISFFMEFNENFDYSSNHKDITLNIDKLYFLQPRYYRVSSHNIIDIIQNQNNDYYIFMEEILSKSSNQQLQKNPIMKEIFQYYNEILAIQKKILMNSSKELLMNFSKDNLEQLDQEKLDESYLLLHQSILYLYLFDELQVNDNQKNIYEFIKFMADNFKNNDYHQIIKKSIIKFLNYKHNIKDDINFMKQIREGLLKIDSSDFVGYIKR